MNYKQALLIQAQTIAISGCGKFPSSTTQGCPYGGGKVNGKKQTVKICESCNLEIIGLLVKAASI